MSASLVRDHLDYGKSILMRRSMKKVEDHMVKDDTQNPSCSTRSRDNVP